MLLCTKHRWCHRARNERASRVFSKDVSAHHNEQVVHANLFSRGAVAASRAWPSRSLCSGFSSSRELFTALVGMVLAPSAHQGY
jgi:hypothetical protein